MCGTKENFIVVKTQNQSKLRNSLKRLSSSAFSVAAKQRSFRRAKLDKLAEDHPN
jgi:hypothetical protein